GGGPSGLVLALALRRNGIPVRIIDKSPTPSNGQRGPAIMPRTQELFRALGVLDEVKKQAIALPLIRTYALPEGILPLKTFHMAPPLSPTPTSPFATKSQLTTDRVEAILRAALHKYSCNVEFGTQLASLAQDTNGVDATIIKQDGQEETQRYDFLVGADGARGVVRKQLGLTFAGESRPTTKFTLGDVVHWHMWGDAKADSVFLRPTGVPNLFALSLTLCGSNIDYERLMKDRETLQHNIASVTGRTDLKVTDVVWITQWSPNIRTVDKFSVGHCFVVGAHIHSITGGQGLNSSVQDSFNLAWKLALVLQGLAPMALLDSYNHERLPVIAEMVDKTTTLLNQTVDASAADGDTARWNRGGPLLMLGVNYRWSSIVIDEQDEEKEEKVPKDTYGSHTRGLKAGDRAPDGPELKDIRSGQASVRFFDVFDVSRHTVLLFSASQERCTVLREVLVRYPQGLVRFVAIVSSGIPDADIHGPDLVLEDTQGHAYAGYHFEGGCDITIVRPDGVLGAVVRILEG
ncbi:FAD binding domain-containing protein, partial [Mycena capillaripes]